MVDGLAYYAEKVGDTQHKHILKLCQTTSKAVEVEGVGDAKCSRCV